MLTSLDKLRLDVSATMNAETKSRLGQFLTPSSIATFMASLFRDTGRQAIHLLDAGAGVGSLTTAFLNELRSRNAKPDITVTAYEIDESLSDHLSQVLSAHSAVFEKLRFDIDESDFIEQAAKRLRSGRRGDYTHAILNPPYKKINSASQHRSLLRAAGIETVNLYAAFLALAIKLLQPGGQVVAIIPRSFCNGPYYRPFRELIVRETAIHRIHLFHSRVGAFRDDEVLQENVILHLERGGEQGPVTISTSTDDRFDDLTVQQFDFEGVIYPDDRELFFHIPTSHELPLLELSGSFSFSLGDLCAEVSTGPVVDFRLRDHLQKMPEADSVPLLYSAHFAGSQVEWPKLNSKKPNAISFNDQTAKWLYPLGWYVIVRRFSSKEERRRLHAGVLDPDKFRQYDAIGFENHLNVFHCKRKGLTELTAYGLTAFLNTTAADAYFRKFNGHTQVNATDLRRMRYPSKEVIQSLGKWARKHKVYDQESIDAQLISLT